MKEGVYAFVTVMLLLCTSVLALVERYALAVVVFGAYLAALAFLISAIHDRRHR